MDKNLQTQILAAFLQEKLAPAGQELDAESFALLADHLALSPIDGPEAEQTRSVELKQSPDGKVSGVLFSLYNITRLSLHDLVGLALKGAAIFTMATETRVKITLAILALANDFYKHIKLELSENEAKVLLAVFDVEPETYTTADVQKTYEQRFGTAIDLPQVNGFLQLFAKMNILHFDPLKQQYANQQRISFTR